MNELTGDLRKGLAWKLQGFQGSEPRGLNVFSKCRCAKNLMCDLYTLCNLSGTLVLHLPGLRRDKGRDQCDTWPHCYLGRLSPAVLPRKGHFLLLDFIVMGKTVLFLWTTWVVFNLNIREDEAFSASNSVTYLWLVAIEQSPWSKRILAWVITRHCAAP